jgi:hypothetical protein
MGDAAIGAESATTHKRSRREKNALRKVVTLIKCIIDSMVGLVNCFFARDNSLDYIDYAGFSR